MHLVWLNEAKVYPETFKTGHQTPKITRFLVSPLFHALLCFQADVVRELYRQIGIG